jgi:hypothetical protein
MINRRPCTFSPICLPPYFPSVYFFHPRLWFIPRAWPEEGIKKDARAKIKEEATINKGGSRMNNKLDQLEFAELKTDSLEKIKAMERNLEENLGEPVYLLAFKK